MVNNSLKLKVDPNAELGLNRQIEAQIRQKIISGELPVATPLPSEHALATQLKVTRDVVRRAYALLQQSGLIESLPARHWRVLSQKKS